MARQNGRDLRIKKDSTVLAVVNTKTVKINNTPVDVTGDTDAGFITMLSRPGTKSIACDVSGFSTDETLRDAAVTGTDLLDTYTIEYLDAATGQTAVYAITGQFFLSDFSETGASDGGLEFTASLQSSGAFSKVSL